ncbi:hypothetical protein [Runella slithyformis]|uniref:Uncharacterized protein n=1 Tax=Runella slithyformis (strain ATCC 29530 / DSM 19594 / LMG 11500 / NCIMB 11436 / LSU 4) TaxID=761193 RepID=A0A7U3ZMA9_RUNSL|nr:hypothetical protein [Runella slithyformis]AEI49842.1 hypothetical protein Runsl_3478 [Runella slithyformis DSM 19594]
MKKSLIIFFAFVSGLYLMSCNRDEVNTVEDDLTESVQLSAARIAASTDTVTKQKCKGKLTEVAAADLPASTKSYITANYAGAEIQFSGKDASGQFVVGLKLADGTHKGLLFNADGTFNKALEKYGRGAKLTKVEATALPASITGYITANYAGYEIKRAGKNDAGEYFVAVKKDDTVKVVKFSAAGAFVEETTPPAHPEGAKGKRSKKGK